VSPVMLSAVAEALSAAKGKNLHAARREILRGAQHDIPPRRCLSPKNLPVKGTLGRGDVWLPRDVLPRAGTLGS
ncbi:MAG: hypothetical protein ACR2H5_26780, partial [Ktedonobacteraceae bacterium]